ncbi:NACHT domain-containing protein [Actinoallomurus soli]|uniref:NACHT domain-containing protein n=1 Tax=Actinoallomurus soli TaxID=2952535 RepID=UPI0020931E35|nr:hypothetical protein [Actinoallomurus soli]MCO5967624.1 hypothetical protein [Actinoallomurus soli]
MAESLTYADALKILGGRPSRLIGLADRLAAAGLVTWTVAALATGNDASAALNLFDLKEEIVRFGHDTVRRISERRSGLSRFDRTQRLAAAHAVLVVSSYFEALEQGDPVIGLERFELTPGEKVAQATGTLPSRGGAELVGGLLHDRLPLPEPHVPYESTRAAIRSTYELMSRRLTAFVRGVAAWDALSGPERTRLTRAVAAVPPVALQTYEQAFRRLATDNREFEVWANLTRLEALGAGLSEVGQILGTMAAVRPGDRPRRRLLRGYRAALSEPIVATGRAPDGVVLPALGDAYVNPRCKVAEVDPSESPADPAFWAAEQVREPHAEAFLSGFLTSPRAVQAPLVVLGEPGSGKSKLTEVLAARLPEEDFLPIRVELRQVAAESMIQEQIEQAVRRQSGERVTLPDLLESADGALPVVMLDGFDEMLQAAGLNRYDYLEQVRDLQRRHSALGQPVAVIVTTRTVVADRVRYPAGTVALRLQPFTDDQVRYWLDVWHRHNAALLAARSRRPLPAETVLAHRELARQPLLLLMLAIFDAQDNALQAGTGSFGQADLYEALLMDFALREVRKAPRTASLPSGEQRRLAEAELEHLAVAALAMFTRGRQTAGEDELDRDLSVLLPQHHDPGADEPAALSPAERTTGRFFFIHRAEARVRDQRARTFEFLHPTFAEFLVAWLAVRVIDDLTAVRKVTSVRPTAAGGRPDDGFLFAVLSFACVAGRAPIVDFLGELLRRGPEEHERRALLRELLDGALYPHAGRSHTAYEPVVHPVTRRLAAYSANLTILLVLLSGEGITADELFPGSPAAAVERWIRLSRLWKAELSPSEWHGILNTLRVTVHLADELRVRLGREDGSAVSVLGAFAIAPPGARPEATDYDLFLSGDPGAYDLRANPASGLGLLLRTLAFLPDWRMGMLLLQSLPLFRAMGDRIWSRSTGEEGIVPGYHLGRLDHTRDAPEDERAATYRECLRAAAAFPDLHRLVLLRLRDDVGRLPAAKVLDLLHQANTVRPTDAYLETVNALWHRLPQNGAAGHGVDGRDLVAALVRAIEQRWPDTDLGLLAPGLRVAAAGRRRTADTGSR